MKSFSRRRYRCLRDLIRDLRTVVSQRTEVRELMHGRTLDPAFRERLMLAVTQVNGCRYCSYMHAREALTAGVSPDELAVLAEGEFDNSPPEQRPALLYAEHFAESDGRPDPEARSRIAEIYGERTARAIDLALHLIRMGNLAGNTFDYLLFLLSFGHWGSKQKEGI